MYLIQSYHLYQFKKNGSGLWFFSICQKMMFTKVVVKCHYHLSCLTMIGPLQLAIHVVQNHHTGEQKSRWDKTNKENYHLKLCMSFVCLVPVLENLKKKITFSAQVYVNKPATNKLKPPMYSSPGLRFPRWGAFVGLTSVYCFLFRLMLAWTKSHWSILTTFP